MNFTNTTFPQNTPNMAKKLSKKERAERQSARASVEGPVVSGTAAPAAAAAPRTTRTTRKADTGPRRPLTFGRDTYIWMGIGTALVFLGMLLMAGGAMPDPETWDPDIIYSFRRTVLAPFVILGGLGVVIYAVFKK